MYRPAGKTTPFLGVEVYTLSESIAYLRGAYLYREISDGLAELAIYSGIL
jgi:hypothetical protein